MASAEVLPRSYAPGGSHLLKDGTVDILPQPGRFTIRFQVEAIKP